MSQPITEELRAFHLFIGHQIEQGRNQLSPEEVLDEWRELYPDTPEADESVETIRAVRQALADMEAGDRGTAASEVLAELRARLASPEK
jgi:hypothetical protein